MTWLADLHLHSPYSYATARQGDLPLWAAWAGVKGLRLIGTGDFTHPEWLQHLEQSLEPAQEGLFALKDSLPVPELFPGAPRPQGLRFCLSAELACHYQVEGQKLRMHHLLLAPGLMEVKKLNQALSSFGRLDQDGRPSLRLSTRRLLEICHEISPSILVIPAHIWTPWYSLLGARSGYQTLAPALQEILPGVTCLETGLSSTPAMNRQVSGLDAMVLLSNSDAHSPAKLGRQANCFDLELSYPALLQALRQPGQGLVGNLHDFPQMGKYFATGHRACQVWFEPGQAPTLCPACAKPLTPGVADRIAALADRPPAPLAPEAPWSQPLVPLANILAEICQKSPQSKGVQSQTQSLLARLGSELLLLIHMDLGEIAQAASPAMALAISRMRQGQARCFPGYDGVEGRVSLLPPSL